MRFPHVVVVKRAAIPMDGPYADKTPTVVSAAQVAWVQPR